MRVQYIINNYQLGAKLKTCPIHKIISQTRIDSKHVVIIFEIKQKEEVLRNSDYYSYEESLDDWNFCGNDIIEECEKQMEYIENSKRINKEVLYNSFLTIIKRLQGIL